MTAMRPLPDFALADWYSDPTDHRSPHDAWLESIEIAELAEGERQEKRTTAITLRLLGAYHDGHIVLRYTDVTHYSVSADTRGQGLGDWLEDRFSVTPSGALRHEITWCLGPEAKTAWFIEARDVSFEWIPD